MFVNASPGNSGHLLGGIMEYRNIKKGIFISRPNRFIANIEIYGKVEVCHVKNTGRCKELLIPNATVFVQEIDNPKRKTKYDLISVLKEGKLINIDSQAPNKVFNEWVIKNKFIKESFFIKPEVMYANSRFDFYIESNKRKIFVEVKGVTLEENGIALFPDAPTERGLKHIVELCKSLNDGYEAYIVFIIQMTNVLYFTPNSRMQKDFADALLEAKKQGVKIIALDCIVTETSMTVNDLVNVKLTK